MSNTACAIIVLAEPGGARAQARRAQGTAVPRTEVPETTAGAADEPDGPARVTRPPRPPRAELERPDRFLLRPRSRRGCSSPLKTAQRFRVLAWHGLVNQLHGQLQELRQVCGQSLRLGVR